MSEANMDAQQQWVSFLEEWPFERLKTLTLEEYYGTDDSFYSWIVRRTDKVGEYLEGPFSSGIRLRAANGTISKMTGVMSDERYVWYRILGASRDEAFSTLRQELVVAAEAARSGDLSPIDNLKNCPGALCWKVAFLYQDPAAPCVLPVFPRKYIRAAGVHLRLTKPAALHKELLAERGARELFTYAAELLATAKARRSGRAKVQETLARFERDSRLVKALRNQEDRELFSRFAEAIHDHGLDWWTVRLTQSGSIRCGRNNSPENGTVSVAAELDPQQSGLRVRWNKRIAEGSEWQPLDEALVEQVEDEVFAAEFRAAAQLDRPGRWPTDYVLEQTEESGQAVAPLIEIDASPLNQILFGPPGTGKTHATVGHALAILDPQFLIVCEDDVETGRKRLKSRFDELVQQERIRFVTFHQSFSYEDFVEGLRAESDGDSGQLRYEVVDGVFKSLCEAAAAKVTQQAEAPVDTEKRKIWKMSLGNTQGSDAGVYEECVQGGYMLLGYGGGIDFTGCKSRGDVQQRFNDAGVSPDGPYDYSVTSVTAFVTKMKPGDLVVVSDGNFKFRAIGEIAGDYAFKVHPVYDPHYSQMRPVKWLRQYSPSLPRSELLNGQFSQMTLYELRSPTLNREKLQGLLGSQTIEDGALFHVGQRFGQGYVVRAISPEVVELDKPKGGVLPLPLSLVRQLLAYVQSGQLDVEDIRQGRIFQKVAEAELEKYIVNGYQSLFAAMVEGLMKLQPKTTTADARVLIIDEINRGNISRIFGELITLIEPSKRAGAEEALSVILPYSKQPFSVPKNVYLIGTMNTADRSLAGLDIALRRRFTFREMPPKPELLDGVQVEGVSVGQLLRVMNQRIEVLLDRDHCLGHAYFMPLRDDSSLERLEGIFRNQILPLLQEYFFEDCERIQWVLNDHRKLRINQFIQRRTGNVEALFGQDVGQGLVGSTWSLNDEAFERLEAYMGIVDHHLQDHDVAVKREASYGSVVLRELTTGSFEVLRGGLIQEASKPVLRELAEQLGIGTMNGSGNTLDVRALGRQVINKLLGGGA